MKKRLLSILTMVAMSTSLIAKAQGGPAPTCSVAGISAEVVSTSETPGNPGSCTATANLYFIAVVKGKAQNFVTVNLWNRTAYPNVSYNENSTAPDAAALGSPLATIVLERDVNNPSNQMGWKLSSVYGAPGVSVVAPSSLQLVAGETPDEAGGLEAFFANIVYFNIRGLQITVPGACSSLNMSQFAADVWGSDGSANNNIVCANKDVPISTCDAEGLPIVSGELGDCFANPRTYSVTISNVGNCRPFFVDYRVFLDVNNNGQIDPGTDKWVNDVDYDGDILYDNVGVVYPNQVVTTKLRPVAGLNQQKLLIRGVMTSVGPSGVLYYEFGVDPEIIENGCAPLPVKLKNFSVQRNSQNKQQVDLNWETALEQINKGFHVQRKTGGQWETVAFVPSAALGGNSTETLRYRFTDNNSFGGVSQYRLLQEDLDGTVAYSEEKAVRGVTQAAAVLIYPNPAINGEVNLLFSEPGNRDIMVSDLSGRVVKSFRESTQNNLKIEGLSGGFYTIKISDRKTGLVSVEKVVVK